MPFQSNQIIKTLVPVVEPAPLASVTAEDYNGEFVNWSVGDEMKREFIKNKMHYYRPDSGAIVLGNGTTNTNDIIKKIVLSNNRKIINYYNTVYACNFGYSDVTPDFLVLTNKLLLNRIPAEIRSVTYTRPEIYRLNNEFNLIPINQNMDAGSTAAMLACYHGATKVYLLGFDGCPDGITNHKYAGQQFYPPANESIIDDKWQQDLGRVIAAYPNTVFYRVNASPPSARQLLRLPNYKIIDQRTFVSLADL